MCPGTIHQPTTINHREQLELAESSRIDSYCLINADGGIRLRGESVIHAGSHVIGTGCLDMGPRAVITYNCVVLTSTADLAYPASSVVPEEQRRGLTGDIRLKRETFVGSGAVIMPDVTLHEGAVVAANAYVDEDIPPWTVRLPNGETRERRTESPDFDR
jgi:acetyltransferase-like isoleucine patch superfamily enzyme